MTSQEERFENFPDDNPYSNNILTEGTLEYFDSENDKQGQPNTCLKVGDEMFQKQEDYKMSPEYSSTDPNYQYVEYSPYSDSQSSYSISESSPDSPDQTNINSE